MVKFLLTLLFASASASAGALSSDVANAIRHASEIRSAPDLEVALSYDRRLCRQTVRGALSLLQAYADHAVARGSLSERDYDAIQLFIGANSKCGAIAKKAIILGSIYILDPGNIGLERSMPDVLPSDAFCSAGCRSSHPASHDGVFKSYNLPLAFVAAELINQGKVRLLDAQVRAERAKSNSIWLEKYSGSVNYRIRGTYSCVSSTIWIDPELRPFNMGGVLLHEIDHLFRDKFYVPRESDFSGGKIDWRVLIKADELSALLQSASSQLFIRQIISGNEFDLNISEKDGPLEVIAQNIQGKFGVSIANLTSPSSQDRGLSPERLLGAKSSFMEIQSRIAKSYFGETEEQNWAPPHGINYDALRWWQLNPALQHPMDTVVRAFHRASSDPAKNQYSLIWLGLTEASAFESEITRITDRTNAPSLHCEQEVAHAKDLKGYLGLQLGGPGTDPSGDGVKGSGDGVKGSGDGVKGDDSIIHACLFDGWGA